MLGFVATIGAARDGSVGEVLVTRRFTERFPVAAASVKFLATASGTMIATVTGLAELELDLAAEGVAVGGAAEGFLMFISSPQTSNADSGVRSLCAV